MSINVLSVKPCPHHDKLLAYFKPEHHDKLKIYTAEELFYLHKIMLHKPSYNLHGDIKQGDVFIMVLQQKIKGYLLGTGKPIYPTAWGKLGRRYMEDFYAFLEEKIDLDKAKEDLSQHFNKIC
jgi:hypothetical protein